VFTSLFGARLAGLGLLLLAIAVVLIHQFGCVHVVLVLDDPVFIGFVVISL
jgi:hypothetical protein